VCAEAGRHPIPGFWFCIADLNHVLIVLNSCLNFYIYCLVGKRFRADVSRGLAAWAVVVGDILDKLLYEVMEDRESLFLKTNVKMLAFELIYNNKLQTLYT
jgi:hypothetical protein